MFSYLFKQQKKCFCLYILIVAIDSILAIALAYVMSICVELAMNKELSQFARYGIIFLIYVCLASLSDYMVKYLRARVLKNAQIGLRNDSTQRLLAMDFPSFHCRNTGDWVSTLTNDIELVGQSYFTTILLIIPDALSFIFSLICVFWISWPIALFVLVLTAAQMLIPQMLSPAISQAKDCQSQRAADFTITATEHLQGFDLLQSFHLTAQSFISLSRINSKWEDATFRVKYLNALAKALSYGVSQLIYVGLYFIGAILVVTDHMSVGSLIAVAQLSVYIIAPLQTFSADVAEIISSKKIIEKLENLNGSGDEDKAWCSPPAEFQCLALDNISFSYGRNPVLSDVSYTFEKGKKYILRGASGSGKTTLTKLLAGSLKPDQGNIFLNGISIDRMAPADYVGFVTVSAQNTFLFDDTLRNNVTLYSQQYSDPEIRGALEKAGFTPVLERFAGGLDERIGQAGQNLSGGEKQRIALARMFLFHTPFLILDESFANLDRESMTELLGRITSDQDGTVLYIGHNIPANIVEMFDTVLEIQDGKMQEA